MEKRMTRLMSSIFLFFQTWGICLFGGPLADKARVFDDAIQRQHCPNGMVFSNLVDHQGKFVRVAHDGDSCIWTGAYVAAQALRYAVTKDPAAQANLEKSLWAYHSLQAMTGTPGFLGRSFGTPELFGDGGGKIRGVGSYSHLLFNPDTSRDQYTGLFLGYTFSWPFISDPLLRDTVKKDILQIGRHLKKNNLALRAVIEGQEKTMFNLNPDYCYQDRITPQEWAKVDDFPFNLLCQWIPFNASSALVLSKINPPPLRGGEALRALFMLNTIASITEDREIMEFFRNEICDRRQFPRIASETSKLLEELYLGRNEETVRGVFSGMFEELAVIGGGLLVVHDKIPAGVVTFVAPPIRFLARTTGEFTGEKLIQVFRMMNCPGFFEIFGDQARTVHQLAGWLKSLGFKKASGSLRQLGKWLEALAVSSVDELADAMRSGVGTNLTFFGLLGLLHASPAESIKISAQDILERSFEPICDEGNSLYTFIRAAYGQTPLPPDVITAAKKTLLDYPLDQRGRSFDHSRDPGVRALPWPDRFGRMDKKANMIFPMNERAPHIFIWQESPRDLRSGCPPSMLVAPVGYLLAYWLGRFRGLVDETD